jgi:plasmid replication initiation protein
VQPDDKDFKTYTIPVAEIIGPHIPGGKTYIDILEAAEKMMSKVIRIDDEKSNRKTLYNVFSKFTIDPDKELIELCFHADLKPHYLNLRSHFTKYSLAEFMTLPSIYSQRLYELLKSWSSEGHVLIETEELYRILDVPDSVKRDFCNFRNRVLDLAYKHIREMTSFYYEWLPVRQGKKKVIAIQFIFNQVEYEKKLAEEEQRDHDRKLAEYRKLLFLSKQCREKFSKTEKICSPKKQSKSCQFCIENNLAPRFATQPV